MLSSSQPRRKGETSPFGGSMHRHKAAVGSEPEITAEKQWNVAESVCGRSTLVLAPLLLPVYDLSMEV